MVARTAESRAGAPPFASRLMSLAKLLRPRPLPLLLPSVSPPLARLSLPQSLSESELNPSAEGPTPKDRSEPVGLRAR